ncbi:KilA-N domain-containing protein [Mesomycoplasma ovipneumoniae]|nr:KilA-N domain-containing protein [Mesomycoplasma ovipneumoniae]MCP9306928.1 KilA-N domain-containing protein [Mesomycoplasma ovipneumoniae]
MKKAGSNTFTLSPQKWINTTNAKGIYVKLGRYGGTFAHKDIAFKFASWRLLTILILKGSNSTPLKRKQVAMQTRTKSQRLSVNFFLPWFIKPDIFLRYVIKPGNSGSTFL